MLLYKQALAAPPQRHHAEQTRLRLLELGPEQGRMQAPHYLDSRIRSLGSCVVCNLAVCGA